MEIFGVETIFRDSVSSSGSVRTSWLSAPGRSLKPPFPLLLNGADAGALAGEIIAKIQTDVPGEAMDM